MEVPEGGLPEEGLPEEGPATRRAERVVGGADGLEVHRVVELALASSPTAIPPQSGLPGVGRIGWWWDGKIPSGWRPLLPLLGIFGGQEGTEGLPEVPFDVPWHTPLSLWCHVKNGTLRTAP